LVGAIIAAVLVGIVAWMKTAQKPVQVSALEPIVASAPTEQPLPLVSAAPSEADPPEAAPDNTIPKPPGPVPPKLKPVSIAAVEELPIQLDGQEPTAELPPVTILENMRTTLRQYNLRFGENPVGDNAEITAALTGKNPKHVVFLNAEDGLRLNDKGQLVDNWNTPYFFHQLSRTEMEIHSAGPDRRMWTADDLVLK
jgi:hypothetical protein